MSDGGFTLIFAICLIAVVLGNGSFLVDDPRNSVLPFFRLIGVIGDILLVYLGVSAYAKSKKKKQLRNEISEIQSHISETSLAIDKIKRKYNCKDIPYIPRSNYIKTPSKFKMIYADVDSIAHEFFEDLDSSFKEISILSSRITNILNRYDNEEKNSDIEKRPVIQSEEQRISDLEKQLNSITKQHTFLDEHLLELEESSAKLHSLMKEIHTKRIVLDEPDNYEYVSFRDSLLMVKNSKKISSAGDTSAKDFFNPPVPEDLRFFKSKYNPLLVFIQPFTYAIFPSVILCFDSNGLFSDALTIEALSISISRNKEHVFVFNESFNSQYSSDDSNILVKGTEIVRWEHTCRDGTPDLRYSSNKQIVSRRDTLEYGELSVSIENTVFQCGFSSSYAIDMVEKSYPPFNATIKQHKQPRTDKLLTLLRSLEINNEVYEQIRMQYFEQLGRKPYCYVE